MAVRQDLPWTLVLGGHLGGVRRGQDGGERGGWEGRPGWECTVLGGLFPPGRLVIVKRPQIVTCSILAIFEKLCVACDRCMTFDGQGES